jgi:putative protease
MDEGLMVPVSRLNALRRAALAALCNTPRTLPERSAIKLDRPVGSREALPRSARFMSASQITKAAQSYFPIRYLPLHAYTSAANGVVVPPVIFDSERDQIAAELIAAREAGAEHALVGNVGHLSLVREAGLIPHGDFRLNVMNTHTLDTLQSLGFADVLLSPELTLPMLRDIGGRSDAIVYGRIPLMLLEKCAGCEVGSCESCDENVLVDRRGERFPIRRLPPHRNLLFNSRPTVMSDRGADLARAKLHAGHFLFSIESEEEVDRVIDAYRNGTPLGGAMRRI